VTGSWHVVKWACFAVFAVYLPVQVLALRRLGGELKNRSNRILLVILVFTMLQSYVQEVFENQEASRVAMVVVASAAIVATGVLAQMLHSRGNSGEQELKGGLSR